ncbi:MAG: TonB-dependent receptor [Campylobacterales bacterium]|nr:TonB-dependent receptor [Campylobacterales bacterium]
MKKIIPLSLIAAASIYAAEVNLAPISVESTVVTQVSQNAKTSADLAQALSESVPSIDMSRRSGIANDIFIRGQKRDNISIEVDGTKICGACPNRMDPPVSHILASQIDQVEVIEGPYDVETFGTMSGGVKITTKKPTKDAHGEVNFGYGSWNYSKVGATASGGNDIVRVLVSGSSETGGQYVDGNGNTLSEQVKNYAASVPMTDPNYAKVQGSKYQTKYEDMLAYKKKSLMAKAFVTVTDNQELQLGVTNNRSDNVLYPNSAMDAMYDYSNLYSIAYDIKDISKIYKDINLQYYYSDVDHPMSTAYRMAAANPAMEMTSQLKTTMQGLKLKNSFDIDDNKLLIGVDGSKRTWDGSYYKNGTLLAASPVSIDNALTKNAALFAKLDKSFGNIDLTLGGRYDSTNIQSDKATQQDNDYKGVNANILTAYNLDKQNKIFLGAGQASRVPDARELYFMSSANKEVGTPNLDQTTNKEVDLGYESKNSLMKFKVKTFYSSLKDYIYYNKNLATNNFTNIDATIYGAELSSSIYATDALTFDGSVSYKRGQKDKSLPGQTDKDLADMAPLRGRLAANYEYANNSIATIETQLSDKWSSYDLNSGEQELHAWGIINMKVKHAVSKSFDFTLGVNNLLDEAYSRSNTYVDLTLLSAGANTMLLNEPGRYVYTNLDFKF